MAELRTVADAAVFPLALPSAEPAREAASALVAQLDDYVLPRLRHLDAPLLAVVGGSTGTGKSTLVNSLIRTPVSAAGVLRPTTRVPVLVCHPTDAGWFAERSVLPGLIRSNRADPGALQILHAPALAPGLALLDAPDIDSVVAANRALGHELLAAADLWLFVTTAIRYADAVPWRLLRAARQRGTTVAVVLDRMPADGAAAEIRSDLAAMLTARGLGDTPVFPVHESTLDGQGMLADREVAPIKRWLDAAAARVQRRRVATRSVRGAVAAIQPGVQTLAHAADDQARALGTLAIAVRSSFGAALCDVEARLRDGSLLRGEVNVRWRELVDDGELRLALRARTGARRAQVSAALGDRPAPGLPFQAAVAVGLVGLVTEVEAMATQRCREAWRAEEPGRMLIAADSGLGRPWPGFGDAAHDLVHGWQAWLRAVARAEASRTRTRGRSYATAATVLLATIAAVAPPAEEITATGPTAAMLRDVLDAGALHALGERARAEFVHRVAALLDAEVARHLDPLSRSGVDTGLAARLRAAATRVGSLPVPSGIGDAA